MFNNRQFPKEMPLTARHSQSGEHVFTLTRDGDGERLDCELQYHGEFGVEARFIRNGTFCYSRRFDTKDEALQWADEERAAHACDGLTLVSRKCHDRE